MSHTSASIAAASATAVVSEPPRPSVVTSLAVETPWKPATSTIWSSSSAARMRSARTSRIRALVWLVSVTMPACEPVSEIARWPRSLIAMAHSAQDIRSPVESSMSISRASGVGETSSAMWISSSVVLPRAERTATTRWPFSRAATMRRAARLRRSASATEVPPNFITTVPDTTVESRRAGLRDGLESRTRQWTIDGLHRLAGGSMIRHGEDDRDETTPFEAWAAGPGPPVRDAAGGGARRGCAGARRRARPAADRATARGHRDAAGRRDGDRRRRRVESGDGHVAVDALRGHRPAHVPRDPRRDRDLLRGGLGGPGQAPARAADRARPRRRGVGAVGHERRRDAGVAPGPRAFAGACALAGAGAGDAAGRAAGARRAGARACRGRAPAAREVGADDGSGPDRSDPRPVDPLRRPFPAGARLVISVTKPGRIGKHTTIVIRRGAAPMRRDRCLMPGARTPTR